MDDGEGNVLTDDPLEDHERPEEPVEEKEEN